MSKNYKIPRFARDDKSIFNKVLTDLQHNLAVILAFLH
jgi:hypothetical protein